VKKEISEPISEKAKMPSPSVAIENAQKEISEKQKLNWPHKRNIHRSQSKGIGI
jgi:hypothetical protein